jgi:hypothetical protein
VAALEVHGPDGEAELARLVSQFGALPRTPALVTEVDRRILWSVPDNVHPVSSVSRLGWGLSVRGVSDYVVVDGEWEGGLVPSTLPFAPIPDWVVALTAEPPPWEEIPIADFALQNGAEGVWCDVCEGMEAEWLNVRGTSVLQAYCERCFECREEPAFNPDYVAASLIAESQHIAERTRRYYERAVRRAVDPATWNKYPGSH